MTATTAQFEVQDEHFQRDSVLELSVPTTPLDILNRLNGSIDRDDPIMGAALNNRMVSMRHPLTRGERIEFIRYSDRYGHHFYRRGLTLVLALAVQRTLPEDQLHIGHSIEHGYYYRLNGHEFITHDLLDQLNEAMEEIVREDLPIEVEMMNREQALEVFRASGRRDKVRLLETWEHEEVQLHRMDSYRDMAYFPAPASTGVLERFELRPYMPGFILRFPEREDPKKIPPTKDQPKLFRIYDETKKWGNILEVNDVGDLNRIIEDNDISEFIKIHEAFHSKKISKIADEIKQNLGEINLVCVAGPSSSGKTTFSKRLGIQLRVHGIKPVKISTDNYFVNREETPRDKDGNYDFESLDALDLELFNRHLEDLINGKQVQVPKFSFEHGRRKDATTPLQVTDDQLIIIEGIHGLNPRLTASVPRHRKYWIYVSALTQLVIDDHNRISTSDSRLIRRIVRDILFRDIPPTENIMRWPSVRRGEEQNIFPHQENADVMFNSALLYELSALRPYILPALKQVDQNHEAFRTAHRIRRFIDLFKTIDHREIPPTSILREFIGGSSFQY